MSADYIPTPGPLPGEQWMPSNGTDGECFIDATCCRCARDEGADELGEGGCPILGASFRGEAVEWRELPSGECVCIAFVPMGERIPEPRCTRTVDMFEGLA